ncbi:hypothetical protein [Agromyces sp. LHK192]|uniref:hypothetical protein n=1 Tax=Agromyces sp. LHK192 TaxID=2498704 RepID=UPI000FDA60B5|nr:hypothetical protein [Agromyces sp. LHK192]
MYVHEHQFPHLVRSHEDSLAAALEQRRVVLERLAEERDATAGWVDAGAARGIRQHLPSRLAAILGRIAARDRGGRPAGTGGAVPGAPLVGVHARPIG